MLTDTTSSCKACSLNSTDNGRPVGRDFIKYLPWFLEDNPGVTCPKGFVLLFQYLLLQTVTVDLALLLHFSNSRHINVSNNNNNNNTQACSGVASLGLLSSCLI